MLLLLLVWPECLLCSCLLPRWAGLWGEQSWWLLMLRVLLLLR
jgi:hypothetical protein